MQYQHHDTIILLCWRDGTVSQIRFSIMRNICGETWVLSTNFFVKKNTYRTEIVLSIHELIVLSYVCTGLNRITPPIRITRLSVRFNMSSRNIGDGFKRSWRGKRWFVIYNLRNVEERFSANYVSTDTQNKYKTNWSFVTFGKFLFFRSWFL